MGDTYRQLQKKLDQYSMGFPSTESGIEIKILHHLFSEDDAGMFLSLSHSLTSAADIAANLNKPVNEVHTQLEDMTAKGLLFRVKKGDVARYATIPFVHGLFEFQVKDLEFKQPMYKRDG